MRKPKKMPRGVYFRGLSICCKFALADGTIERRTIGPASQFSPEDCERKRLNWKAEVSQGTYQGVTPAPMPSPVKRVFTVGGLWEPYITSYRNSEGRDENRLEITWNHLKPMFERVPVGDVTTVLTGEYIAARKADGVMNGTINRELATLRAMFNHGARQTPPAVDRVPWFGERLKESAPRKGFVKDEQYALLKANADKLWLKALLAVAYSYGFRKGELLNLRVRQVDLLDRLIELERDTTKSDEPRKVKMTSEVFELIRACVSGKNPDDYVFTREDGSPVVDFRDDWYALCVVCKLGEWVPSKRKNGKEFKAYRGLNVHDLRRSAVRNLIRAGVPERVCMDISGHATRSVFDRYNIIDTSDLVRASEKLEQARKVAKTDTEQTQPIYAQN